MTDKPKIFKKLEELAPLVPAVFCWTDLNCVTCGGNELSLEPITISGSKLICKSAYDLYAPEIAAMIEEHCRLVMQTGKRMTFEETYIDLATGVTQYVIATRFPLFEDGKVVGLVEAIVDITDSKKKERLEIETEQQKTKIEEDKKYQELVQETYSFIYPLLQQLRKPDIDSKDINYNVTLIEGKIKDLRRNSIKIEEK